MRFRKGVWTGVFPTAPKLAKGQKQTSWRPNQTGLTSKFIFPNFHQKTWAREKSLKSLIFGLSIVKINLTIHKGRENLAEL